MRQILIIGIMVCVLITQFSLAQIPRTLTYQGIITNTSGTVVTDGTYDLTFGLYEVATGGAALWTENHPDTQVTKGVFNVILGEGIPAKPLNLAFDKQYWLEIAVNGAVLAPRIKLASSPYSLNAANVADKAITTSKLSDDAVIDIKIADGQVVRSVNGLTDVITLAEGANIIITVDDASKITIKANEIWKLKGNAGTDPATHFMGTTDNKALELRVNNIRALRLEPNGTSPNVIGGYGGNKTWLEFGAYGTTISGGGESGLRNAVTDNYCTVGGGIGNRAGNADEITNNTQNATVGGGNENIASGGNSTIGGGYKNEASGHQSTVGGGENNKASGDYSATVGGGNGNIASGVYSTIGGGYKNEASGHYSTIAGGDTNKTIGDLATVGGGFRNEASGHHSTVGGGDTNKASGNYSTAAGGYGNKALGNYSFATGRNANADEHGSFIFADSTNIGPVYFNSRYPGNDFSVLCTGGARFVTQWNPNNGSAGGVNLPAGGTGWSSLCDRNTKANFAQVNGCETLERLASIPIQTWNYKAQDPSIRHIGPMAQDFYAAFGMGEDDNYISTIDIDGVALSAIQGLYELLKEKDKKIATQQEQINSQHKQIARLEARLSILEKVIFSNVQGDQQRR